MNLLTLDFETYYDREYSLSKLTTEAYIRDLRFEVIGVGFKENAGETRWFSGSDGQTKSVLQQLNIPNRYLLCHNTAFDAAILNWRYGIRPKYMLDTLSMARPVTGQTIGVSLAALAKKFLPGCEKGTEVFSAIGKRRADFTPEELAKYGVYCQNDVQLTYLLFHVLQQFSTPKEMYIIDMLLRMYTDPVLELDKVILTEHLKEVRAKKDKLLEAVDLAYCNFMPGTSTGMLMSNQQFAEILRGLGVEPPTKISKTTGKTTWAFSKNDTAFKELLTHEDLKVQAVMAARFGVKSTLEETRTESFLAIADRGCLPIPIGYYNAHTGRSGGQDKINLQNLPRGGKLRKAIKAPAGHVIVAGDSSQIEARMTAFLAGQWDLVGDFAANVDSYSKFASGLYGFEVTDKDHPVERFVGKTSILGLGFGMGPEKFKHTLKVGQISVDMPLHECQKVVSFYRQKHPRIPELWESAGEALIAMVKGYTTEFGVGLKLRCTPDGIELPNGMMIRYPNLRWVKRELVYDSRKGPTKIYGGKCVENVVQALARIVVFDQMAQIDQKLKGIGKVPMTVHDEVVACVPEREAEACVQLMREVMSKPPRWAPGLPVACKVAYGRSYGDCK